MDRRRLCPLRAADAAGARAGARCGVGAARSNGRTRVAGGAAPARNSSGLRAARQAARQRRHGGTLGQVAHGRTRRGVAGGRGCRLERRRVPARGACAVAVGDDLSASTRARAGGRTALSRFNDPRRPSLSSTPSTPSRWALERNAEAPRWRIVNAPPSTRFAS